MAGQGGRMTKRILAGVVVVLAVLVTVVISAHSKSPIQGVWRVTETTGGQGAATPTTVNAKPQPGFYIFTASHYSINRVYGDKPRMPATEPGKPTMEELTDANRFVGQFGTYETKGDTITMRPLVARSPATMNAATAPGA